MVTAVKILAGALPTNIRTTRGVDDRAVKMCRNGCGQAETDLHVLTSCRKTRDAISRRHNLVRDKIAKELRKNSCRVLLEHTWLVGARRYRPDITVDRGSERFFVEVTIPYEQSMDYLKQRVSEKRDYYLALTDPVNGAVPEGMTAKVVPIVIGCTGTIITETKNALKSLNLFKHVHSLQMISVAESARIWNHHVRRKSGADAEQ
jgi:hypothetical protein